MFTPCTPAFRRSLPFLLFGVCLAQPVSAQPVEAPPQSAPEAAANAPPPALPADLQRTHGQLLVRMQLPPGTVSAGLFLNNTYVGELPGGVLPAPLWLLPGGYAARVSAPALHSYEANLVMAPGQIIELAGVLYPEAQPVPLLGAAPVPQPIPPPPGAVLVPPPPPPVGLRPRRSARQIYRSVIYGIGFTALGIVVVGGVAIGIACGAGKCKSSGSHHDFD